MKRNIFTTVLSVILVIGLLAGLYINAFMLSISLAAVAGSFFFVFS